MPKILIEDLPLLDSEAALFDAAMDPAKIQMAGDQIIIAIIVN